MISLALILLLSTIQIAAALRGLDEPLGEFVYPDYRDFNLTFEDVNQTTGYNVWMPKYVGGDPEKPTFVMLTGGCIPVDEGGSNAYQDARIGFAAACDRLDIECQCRPIIRFNKWNVPNIPASITRTMHRCSWETYRVLEEHRTGLIKLGGIATKCDYRHPEIYNLARELNVPIILIGKNAPRPGDEEYLLPQPDYYVGTNDDFFGRTMARLLKQLNPLGGEYGFVMQWSSPSSQNLRDAFNDEMYDDPSDKDDRVSWTEVERYPYKRYNRSVSCHYMTCQMEGLVQKTNINSMVFLFATPLRSSNWTNWVDAYRSRNLTLIGRGDEAINLLHSDYLNGLVGEVVYDQGKRSAELMFDTYVKMSLGQTNSLEKKRQHDTKILAYSIIPFDLDQTNPPSFDSNLLGNLVYFGYVAFGVLMTTVFFCCIWMMYNRDAIVISAAQPFFLYMLATGIVIFGSTMIPISFDDGGNPEDVSDIFAIAVCMSQPWLAFTGFTIMFSALFSKCLRVNKLFHSEKTFTRVVVSQTDVLIPFGIIFSLNVTVLIIWTFVDPLTYVRLVGEGTDFWNREIESYGACRSDNTLAFLIPLALINFMTLGVACWQAFEVRTIESAFSEAKYIGYSIASLLQSFLTGFPILAIVKDDPRAFYMVLTMLIFILSEGILLLIFLPKMIMAYKFSHMTEQEQRHQISEQIMKSANGQKKGRSHQSIDGSAEASSKIRRAMAPVNHVKRGTKESNKDVIAERFGTHSKVSSMNFDKNAIASSSVMQEQVSQASYPLSMSILSDSSTSEVDRPLTHVRIDETVMPHRDTQITCSVIPESEDEGMGSLAS